MTKHDHLQPSRETEPQRVRYFTESLGSGALRSIKPLEGMDEIIDSTFSEARKQIFEKFPSNLEGLDINRVYTFLDQLELRRSPLVVINKEQRHELVEFINATAGIKIGEEMEPHGVYEPTLDIAFVFRDEEKEKDNGTEFTESIIAHELAHSSSIHTDMSAVMDYSINNLGVTRPRVGQLMTFPSAADPKEATRSGTFLEEGFAEYIRGRYISEILGLPGGLSGLNQRTLDKIKWRDYHLSIPSKYVYREGKDQVAIIASSAAGASLELLMEQDPDLLPAMIKARKNVDGLREVTTRVNGIEPGLYKKLRDDFNSEATFYSGLSYVTSVLE